MAYPHTHDTQLEKIAEEEEVEVMKRSGSEGGSDEKKHVKDFDVKNSSFA